MSFKMIFFILQTLLFFKSYSISTKDFSNATIRIFKITLFFQIISAYCAPLYVNHHFALGKEKRE